VLFVTQYPFEGKQWQFLVGAGGAAAPPDFGFASAVLRGTIFFDNDE